MVFDYKAAQISRAFVFGSVNPSSTDYQSHIQRQNRPRELLPEVTWNTTEYLSDGPGRFINPALFDIIQRFFENTRFRREIRTFEQTVNDLGGRTTPRGEPLVVLSNYATQPGLGDHNLRSYIAGTSRFILEGDRNTRFIYDGNNRRIEGNLFIRPLEDNFDFEAGNRIAEFGGQNFVQPLIDPYRIGRQPVFLRFTGNANERRGRRVINYSGTRFARDTRLARANQVVLNDAPGINALIANGLLSLAENGGKELIENLAKNDPFLSYQRDGRRVIYGSVRGDRISALNLTPSYLVGGPGNDRLSGGRTVDLLSGGDGNDTLLGGFSVRNSEFRRPSGDIAEFRGSVDEYNIELLEDGQVRVEDTIRNRDGTDLLRNIEFGQFTDQRIKFGAGQDIAFVIDTTGSMADDIDAVKARANEIIDAVFGGAQGATDSRIAVVGYNDPSTNTFLSFTNQTNIADRKSAARNAINSITTGGGGDLPEAVNAGLIRALSGGAGEWRENASVRRIILFGDAPPKDTELRSQVLELARDVGTNVPAQPSTARLVLQGDIQTAELSEGLTKQSFALAQVNASGEENLIPIEIFTVLIGSDPTTRSDFESLSSATGGTAFSATDATDIVDVLIEAIETPTNDEILGTNERDILRGTSGNDTIRGAAQNDDIFGLRGDDQLFGDNGIDKLRGGVGNDTLQGGAERDDLFGGSGDDVLVGGVGSDALTGGVGKDQFIFTHLSNNVDLIQDFNALDDKLTFRKSAFTEFNKKGQLKPNQFSNVLGNITSDTRIIYNEERGNLFYDPDGSGSQRSVLIASLTPGIKLNNQAFSVI